MSTQTTPESALPLWEGRPVPWVTRWTGERIDTPLKVSLGRDGVHLNYEDGQENRDGHGVLWRREGLTRSGEPEYSQLNAYRQQACMSRRRCQVCGSKIDERPIRWLMSRAQLRTGEQGEALTMSPPTCSSCIPLALDLCPHLKSSPHVILKVLDYEPWGVYGEGVTVDPETGKGRNLRGVHVPYVEPPIKLTAVVAFQQVVRLTKFVVEGEGP